MAFSLNIIEEEFDFSLVGIRSDFQDYQLAYWLNKGLKIQLKKELKGLDITNGKSKKIFVFSLFSYFDESSKFEISLISNRTQVVENSQIKKKTELFSVPSVFFLAPEKKQFDYFVHLKNFHETPIQHIEAKLKKTRGIFFAQCIDNKTLKLKTKKNLIF